MSGGRSRPPDLSFRDRFDDLLALPAPRRRRILRTLPGPAQRAIVEHWLAWAHDGQRTPAGDWRVWLIRAGRGFGKTRAGAEWVSEVARGLPQDGRIALVGGTIEDARRVMVEGASGLLAVARDDEGLRWRPNAGELTFPSGATAFVYSAEAPEALRGPEHHAAWVDELGAVPTEIDAAIDRTLTSISPIRSVANVVKVGSAGYRKLVTTGGAPSGWAAETAARPETATPVFQEIAPPSGELYANPSASQAMLDDAAFDVEAWLADEIATEFARAEGAAFVNGSGVNRPRGFLQSPLGADADAARAFGTLQYLPTGAAGDFGADAAERLIDLVQALRAPYRQGAAWVMNAETLARIRKFKTGDGAFLWAPGLSAEQPQSLLGHPVVECGDMPDIAADAPAIAFGDFRAGYLIAERTETAILRDPYTNKPFVSFYATKRIGGCVSNSEAIKVLRFSAA